MMNRFVVLMFLVLLTGATPVSAAPASLSSLVIDARTGSVLQRRHEDQLRYPASLTKMMTLYLLFDSLERGKITMSTRMRVSAHAASMPPSKLGLRSGTRITVRDAILALTTKSANDVAVVVAEHLAGSESRFAQRMTTKARALGMRRTTYRNASGLHHPAQRTTARDASVLGRALVRDHPDYYRNFGARSFAYRHVRHANHNRLIGAYRGADGIKTGYTAAAGYNLVASARRNGVRLIGVVMGSPTANSRNALMKHLLDRGFQKARA